MNMGKHAVRKSVAIMAVLAGVGATACAPETASDDAPVVDTDGLGVADQGTFFGGWTQTVIGTSSDIFTWANIEHTLTRNYAGSDKRGGGACWVYKTTMACSSDAECIGATQAAWGPQGWGYCYSGLCYERPASQVDSCLLSPLRDPGTLSGALWMTPVRGGGQDYVLGCMTKLPGPNGGPNTACAGTDTSLYMRQVNPVTISTFTIGAGAQ